jgi:two-component system LytT family sensor kinase
MAGSVVLPVLVGVLIGTLVTLAVWSVWRYTRGSRELGSDGEQATFRTLHLASRAAEHLRRGLEDDQVSRAARDLRTLLGCDILAITTVSGTIAIDGPGEHYREMAATITARMPEAGLIQVLPVPATPGRDAGYAIAAPVFGSAGIVGAVIAFANVRRAPLIRATGEVATWVSAQLRLGELDAASAALAEAELRALRAQISPHFIYNALTAIASFINTDPGKARELVLEFADFTRYSFRKHGDFTTLAEELRSIHSYLMLERARFGERLEVILQIAPETLSTVIPFLSLQPLVENSVRHGLESRERGGVITITAEVVGTDVRLTVEDNGAGIDPDEVEQLLGGEGGDDHIGLRNVDLRLRQVYGDAYGLVVETNVGAGTLVRLLVPQSQPLHDTGPVGERPEGRTKITQRRLP